MLTNCIMESLAITAVVAALEMFEVPGLCKSMLVLLLLLLMNPEFSKVEVVTAAAFSAAALSKRIAMSRQVRFSIRFWNGS